MTLPHMIVMWGLELDEPTWTCVRGGAARGPFLGHFGSAQPKYSALSDANDPTETFTPNMIEDALRGKTPMGFGPQ
jgi:hypothetical protein